MTHQTDQDIAWKMIEEIDLCMFVTHDGSGEQLRARPMSAHPVRDEDAIYFLTDTQGHKDEEVEINDNVCLTFADNSAYRYLSVTGTANVLDDRAKIAELWDSDAEAFWDSKDDPSIRLLRVRPAMAEFWDSPGKIVTTIKMAAAAITGSKPDIGQNRKVAL
ncbi:pyridoxamine 5'-phosphate oxidase family protein [Bosea sp. PAMC 26642]|uniref:pyridoxamine 5'-phosphate oxidase family protein n=1 Tax=Bosea sp. (strain PAMC 26642) TaxID=1792307 RepID=UPI00077020DE|nr:pyridoxamine 5'-phosphate oxidase family protein [Bosea sp. PAMC 26642]AMJ60191.1 general stress protein [Bosea sp. PAMC 26642]